jgi:hypothetical protein
LGIIDFRIKASEQALGAFYISSPGSQLSLTRLSFLQAREVMINLATDGEQSSQLIEMIKKFPTTAFLAGRLKEVGWESDYGQCLLTQFREDLIEECGDELSKVLEHFRLVSFESSSR